MLNSAAATEPAEGTLARVAGMVSVVVPCYNQGHFVEACVESALAQRGVALDVVVVNDGSTDDSAARLVALGDAIRYVAQPNGGLSNARNVGLRHARGEYVLFLDADDLLAPDSIARRIEAMTRTGADLAVCRTFLFAETGSDGRPRLTSEWRLPVALFDIHLCHFNFAPPHAWLWRRSCVDTIGEFDQTLRACEDYDFLLRAVIAGARVVRVANADVYYRRHASSMSANHANQYRHDVIMHGRLQRWLLRDGSYPQDAFDAKLVAYVLGLLTSLRNAAVLDRSAIATLCGLLETAVARLSAQSPGDTAIGAYYAGLALRRARDARAVAADSAPPAVWDALQDALRPRQAAWWRALTGSSGLSPYERLRCCKLGLLG